MFTSVFVKGEKLMKDLTLQSVGPDFILGFPDHPMFCVAQKFHLVIGTRVPHEHSSFLENEGKKTGTVTDGSPYTLSSPHVCFFP